MTSRFAAVWTYALGLLAVLVGLALRLAYALHASPYIDEFTTIWAAQQVLERGLPQFPTGAIYTQGLIYTYLDALALALGQGVQPFLARLPSLILSVVTLAFMVYGARRLYRAWPVGLAAFWLAVDAQAILWGGRARTYALLQLLVLLAFLAWYRGAIGADRAGWRWLAIALLVVALVEQPLILLLLPPLAVLAVAVRGWRWLRQPVVWLQALVVVVAVVARWLLYNLMVPAGTTAISTPRAFVDLTQPLLNGPALVPFFVEPNRIVPALFLAAGAIWLLLRARRARPRWVMPVLSIVFVLVIVVVEMLFVVGVTWRETRYLYPLVPLLFLGAEGVAVPGLRWLAHRLARWPYRWTLVGLTAALLLVSAWLAYPGARAAATRDELGYDRALAVVDAAWTEGDALATIAPAAAFALLDHADYLAIEEGAQALVVERDGVRVDGWTGLPLLDTPQRLAQALDDHDRLWFVADEMRLNRHFGSGYLRQLWDRMELVAFDQGIFVFRSRSGPASPAERRTVRAEFSGEMQLVGYALSDDRPQPGQTVTVTLWWAPEVPHGPYTAFVHLIDQAGEGIVGHDGPLLGGLYPVERWHRSERSLPFPDRHPLTLPPDLSPGRYRLETGLYRSTTGELVGERITLDFLRVGGEQVDWPAEAEVARFADGTRLASLRLEGAFKPGETARLRLAWQAGPQGLDADYTVFLHLLDSDGQIAQQFDAPPAGGWYPTHFWRPGEIVLDEHDLAPSPMLPPGAYHLIAGLYRADGTRLLLDDGADFVQLAEVEVVP
jgi:4-amino-4-deoxy-L-arabinose transferase-like glycosyltransferase